KVADGASQLLIDVLGRNIGNPVRAAIGASNLPNGMTVEIKGDIIITDELAKKLDRLDTKKLLSFLDLNSQALGLDDYNQQLQYLDIKGATEKYTNHILKNLNGLSEEEFKQKIDSLANKDEFIKAMNLTGPEQKSD